jgi:hypothetical protein
LEDTLMPAWEYSGARKKYPVNLGETWEIGRQTLVCGDLEEPTNPFWGLLARVDGNMTVHFADPPWGANLARSYRTKAGVDGDKGRPVDYPALQKLVATPAQVLGGLLYVENGNKQIRDMLAMLDGMGGTILRQWPITYYRTKPAALAAVWFGDGPAPALPDLSGIDDEFLPARILKGAPWPNIIDPCAGRGITASSAAAAGRESLTNELSPYRMAEALQRIVKVTGGTPVRVG